MLSVSVECECECECGGGLVGNDTEPEPITEITAVLNEKPSLEQDTQNPYAQCIKGDIFIC